LFQTELDRSQLDCALHFDYPRPPERQ
jgi:hypothetical protein